MASDLHYKDDSTFKRYLVMASAGELAAIKLMRSSGHEFKLDGFGAGSARIFKDGQNPGQSAPKKGTEGIKPRPASGLSAGADRGAVLGLGGLVPFRSSPGTSHLPTHALVRGASGCSSVRPR